MSESVNHQLLVEALVREISNDSVWINQPIIYSDSLNVVGTTDLPPTIGNNRPDVFARDMKTSLSIIGEAKTTGDIDCAHTFSQLISFFDYLNAQEGAELWMAVAWLDAGTALRVCKHARKRSNAHKVTVKVIAFMTGNTNVRRVWCE